MQNQKAVKNNNKHAHSPHNARNYFRCLFGLLLLLRGGVAGVSFFHVSKI